MNAKRGKSISIVQKELLVRFMETNEELRNKKFTANTTYRKVKLWKQLADDLNRRTGAKKNWRQWRKVILFFSF